MLNADDAANGGGVYTSYFTNNGIVEATNGGSFTFGSATTFTNAGRLYLNNGTFYSVKTINVGSGSLGGVGTISAAVSMGSTSSLAFDLGGATKGSGYDSLTFRANLALAGSLKLFLINGFKPTASQTFTIATAINNGVISGAFSNAASGSLLDTADGLGAFTVTYNSNQIVLSNFQFVPEPASAALLGLAATSLLRRRRRSELRREVDRLQ